MFVFGDLLIENGNNNDLPSFAKANYFPYGIDFNGGPTGRFSNDYTMVDEIGISLSLNIDKYFTDLLGLPLIPAHSEASGDQMLHGVNYASAAAGFRLELFCHNCFLQVGRIPFGQQIRNFQNTLDQITDNLGADDAARSIAKCIFFVGMGSNDYLNNYLMPNYPTRNHYNAQQYADQLTRLYNLAARKFVIAGLGRLGCIPSILAQNSSGTCSDEVNRLVLPFNANVKTMINNLNTNLPGSKFIYIDIARMFEDMLLDPRTYGFIVANCGCCGLGRNRGQVTCLPLQTPSVNIIIARKAFTGDRTEVYPMDIQQLVTLDIERNQ
ncbi:unnamed protein product [Malus baccata var. baccata]